MGKVQLSHHLSSVQPDEPPWSQIHHLNQPQAKSVTFSSQVQYQFQDTNQPQSLQLAAKSNFSQQRSYS